MVTVADQSSVGRLVEVDARGLTWDAPVSSAKLTSGVTKRITTVAVAAVIASEKMKGATDLVPSHEVTLDIFQRGRFGGADFVCFEPVIGLLGA
jgi:hypothetical protein